MKRVFTSILILAGIGTALAAQDAQTAAAEAAAALAAAPEAEVPAPKPSYWDKSVKTNITFAQTSLKNWAAGGFDNISLAAYVDANANYAKDKLKWTNRLQLDYGFLYSDDKPIMQKVKDQIYFQSNGALDTPVKNLFYSADFSFKTQFGNNYNYGTPAVADPTRQDWKDARVLKSGLFAPAYVTLGLGIKWTPKPWFTANFAPLTGGFVIVDDPLLRKGYGMELHSRFQDAIPDPAPDAGSIEEGYLYRSSRFELGAQLKADAKVKINDNFEINSQLVLFSNYLKNPQNLRVNWDNRLFWKLAKYFTATFSTSMIYDDTIRIKNEDHDANGYRTVQYKHVFEFGFTYTIASKK
ncbi:MAG: DUF3078 domain-containing protein [Bacteroidales bacterium]|nr:DUF3078 domain-containing protein [Bacteroidales bacterium]